LQAQTQNLLISITDDTSGEPIEFAFVFFENTTIGGNTDQAGQILFEERTLEDYTIVITHMLYEEVKIKGSEINNRHVPIRLKPKAFDLDEVIVKTKKGKSKNYKKWMKKFKNAFIGNRKVRRKVEILNPEVIWFEEKDDILYAYAIDNIKLRNELTGYIMHVALSKFSLSDVGDITYSGSVYYDDITDELKKPESIEKRRKSYFRHSRQLFFKSLFWKHPVNEEEYVFGITQQKEDETYVYNEIREDKLNWKRGIFADTLEIDDYLTITLKDKILESFRRVGLFEIQNRKGTGASFLLSKTGKFIVNKKGYLLNQSDIEESGYWTSVRMAHELPSDYVGNVYFHQEESISTITELQQYTTTHKPEKIYVHTDKSTYLPYENLWFKAYLVNAVDHSMHTPSEVVYVDLVDEEGEVVKNWLLNSQIGLTGDFQWNPNFRPGKYLLRAYTNHMRNQGEQFFFEKELTLTDLSYDTDIKINEGKVSEINFYPEGGDLIEGVASQVAFATVDSLGQPVAISGVIKDNYNQLITSCQSIHRGIGMFQLEPAPSTRYYLETTIDSEKVRFELPKVQASGISMRVNATDKNDIFIDILSSNKAIHEDAFLIGHMRGEVFAFVNKLSLDKPLTISKSTIPPGVVHFTIFDQHERPQAERLIFNDRNYEKSTITSEDIHLKEGNHSMTFTIDSSYLETPMDLSMSIVDESHYTTALEEQNISSYLHLNSDLERHISGLNAYLKNIDQTNRYYLDLILRTQAWRRFTWKDIMNHEALKHPIETGYSITGQVTEKDSDTPIQSRVMITALGDELYYDQLNSDANGEFLIENLNFKDKITYIIQARKGAFVDGEEESIEIEGDRLVDIDANSKLGLPFQNAIKSIGALKQSDDNFRDENLEQLNTTYLGLQNIDTSIWKIEAPEVTISGKRGNHTSNRPGVRGLLYMDYADWIAPATSGISLLSAVAPSRRYHYGAEGKLMSTQINFYGETVVVPSQVIIDGFGAEPGGGSTSTPHRLRTLPADMIETIYVGEGVVIVTTRNIPRSVEKSLDSGIIHIDHPGYYQAREFAMVSSSTPGRFASTVHWDPNVIFDDNGNLKVAIKEAMQKPGYIVVLEGVSSQGDIISFRRRYETAQE